METEKVATATPTGRFASWFAPKLYIVLNAADRLSPSQHRNSVVDADADIVAYSSSLNARVDDNAYGCDFLLTAEAQPVEFSLVSTPLWSPHVVETGVAMPVGHLRPEFIYIKILKPNISSHLGITLRQRRDKVYLARIKKNGLLNKSLLQAGDQILAINGVSCVRSTASKVGKLIRNSKNAVAIVVRNEDGDPNLVSCTVEKPDLESKVGVCIRSHNGTINISRVHTTGLFDGSLLSPGHRCIQIGDTRVDGLCPRDAANLIRQCDRFVTIVSRPKHECAMVLSCEVHKSWWSAITGSLSIGNVCVARSQLQTLQ